MYDLWVEDKKTKKCWRVSDEEARKLCEGDIWRYKFYPVCPKEAPTMDIPEENYEQMSIWDYGGKR